MVGCELGLNILPVENTSQGLQVQTRKRNVVDSSDATERSLASARRRPSPRQSAVEISRTLAAAPGMPAALSLGLRLRCCCCTGRTARRTTRRTHVCEAIADISTHILPLHGYTLTKLIFGVNLGENHFNFLAIEFVKVISFLQPACGVPKVKCHGSQEASKVKERTNVVWPCTTTHTTVTRDH